MSDTTGPVRATAKQRLVGELAFLALIVAFMVGFYRSMEGLQPTARHFPLFVLAVMVLLVIANIITAVRDGLAEIRTEERDESGRQVLVAMLRQAAKPIATLVMLFVFVELIPILGFFTAIAVFLGVLSVLYGVRRPVPLLLSTLGTTVVAYWLFAVVLGLRLPSGMFI